MFSSKGWEYFQEDVAENIQNIKNSAPSVAETNDLWQQLRGQIRKLEEIQGYQTLKEYEEQALEEAEEDASL